MDRVCRHFSNMIQVEHAGEDLKLKTRRQTVHPFIDTGELTIFLDTTWLWDWCLYFRHPSDNPHLFE